MTPAARMAVHVGDLFRQYRVVERIGEGGMGVVYRAHDTTLDRDVALKFVTLGPGAAGGYGDRWRQEARALAALNHPNIVTIYEIGDVDGAPFLALEWVGGGSLSGAAVERPLGVEAFARLALPIADALAAAHDSGIIHRDVKPANVLITADGRVKLADFGLARIGGEDVTQAAELAGTVAYMSPEQAAGAALGPPTDVFSFGVLAYELLAGERPFPGANPGAVLAAILADRRVRLLEHRPDIPVPLADAIETCLAHDPPSRFSSGAELARALRRALADAPRSTQAGGSTLVTMPVAGARAVEQQIRFTTTTDGVSLAYATLGDGPCIVRVLGHFTHLEVEWGWPDLRRFWECLAGQHTVVRYDGRGMGLSDRYEGEFTEETRQRDLEAVVDALGDRQVVLLGISEGGWTAAQYAVAHPDRVTHLVLYGAYARGARARPGYDAEEDEALVTLIRKGWGRDTPAFRQVLTSRFFQEDADPRLIAHFNELQRVSADAGTAARYYAALHTRGDGRDLFRQVTVPTLVLHCRDDLAVSADEGRLLASTIPGAQLVMLPSGTHYFPTDAEVVTKAAGAIERFVLGGR
jgi:pimeloyl-ACP methyl ester carboxylesterase